MRLTRANVLTIRLLAEFTIFMVGSEPVSMYVKQEATSVNYIYVNFYNDTFKRLYDCMTAADNGQCNVHAEYQSYGTPHQGINWKAINIQSRQTAHLDQSYFTCLFSQNENLLKCTRNNTSQCEKDKCDSFRLQGSSICDNQCVYLMRTYADEELVLSTTESFENCDPVCTTTAVYIPSVHNTKPSSHPSVTSTLPSDHTSEATTNINNNIANTSSTNSPPAKQFPIIIGVVCSLVIVIIVVVVGIMYRRKKLIKSHTDNNGISTPQTDAKYNGGHGQGSLSSTRNVLNKPDVLSTLPHSGHGGERNEESEDGYYTIDKDMKLNRYENGLNTVSPGISNIHGGYPLSSHELKRYQNALVLSSPTLLIQEQDDNSQIPHTHEGDYSVISDNDSDKYSNSVNEERNVDGGYTLAKDVSIVDVIDVSSQPKNVYSRFGNDDTIRNNPYDMLLQPHEILDSRKTSTGVTQMKRTVDDDAAVANTTVELVENDSRSQAPKTLSDMARDTTVVFPEYATVNKTKT